ncbi:hypothetical protein [Nocardiopsis baichengensis]|uniref:hypothetical protein n=1 Tax=Nocardiopsis baichengensis TaxID=280240 RepID=UPI000344CD0F|nr:hypothetical protein [Nocardiopsis baichengensis]
MMLQSVLYFLLDALTAVVGVIALARGGKAPSGTGPVRTAGALLIVAALVFAGWRVYTMVFLYDTLLLPESVEAAAAVQTVTSLLLWAAAVVLILVSLAGSGRAEGQSPPSPAAGPMPPGPAGPPGPPNAPYPPRPPQQPPVPPGQPGHPMPPGPHGHSGPPRPPGPAGPPTAPHS